MGPWLYPESRRFSILIDHDFEGCLNRNQNPRCLRKSRSAFMSIMRTWRFALPRSIKPEARPSFLWESLPWRACLGSCVLRATSIRPPPNVVLLPMRRIGCGKGSGGRLRILLRGLPGTTSAYAISDFMVRGGRLAASGLISMPGSLPVSNNETESHGRWLGFCAKAR